MRLPFYSIGLGGVLLRFSRLLAIARKHGEYKDLRTGSWSILINAWMADSGFNLVAIFKLRCIPVENGR